MTLDDDLRRLFRDERLDVPVPDGMHQAIFERVRRRRQRRRRPAWFTGGATMVVLVGGGIAFGAGIDVPLLGSEAGDDPPSIISESSRPPVTSRLDVPLPLDPGRPQYVPDPGELQQREPQRLSPRPTQGGLPPLEQLTCPDLPPDDGPTLDMAPIDPTPPETARGEVPVPSDPCAPRDDRDPLRPLDIRPYLPSPAEPSDSTPPTEPSSEPSSEPEEPSSSAMPSSPAPPPG